MKVPYAQNVPVWGLRAPMDYGRRATQGADNANKVGRWCVRPFPVDKGVCQGGILSTLEYKQYINPS